MQKNKRIRHPYAVNEIIGGLILLLIALLSFSAIYLFVFPLPSPDVETHVKLSAYVANDGYIILEHDGGDILTSYRIDVRDINGTLIGSKLYYNESDWMEIGDFLIPISKTLDDEEDFLKLTVVSINEGEEVIFDGVLYGHPKEEPEINDTTRPYLISSLLTDTTNEDLICFNKTSSGESINSSFSSTTNVYNWKVDGSSIYNLLYGFDFDYSNTVIDHANNYDGSIIGATYTSNGKNGGAYIFDGDDSIDIPYCFTSPTIGDLTIETWIKTSENDGTILSFNRSDYFSLAVVNGKVKWSVTSNGNTEDLIGLTSVSDNSWHHICVTYEQNTGISSIFIDGLIDVSTTGLNPGDLGSASQTSGFIGMEKGVISSSSYQSFFSDNFETNKGWTIENEATLTEGEWEIGLPGGWGDRGDPLSDSDGSGNCAITGLPRNVDVDGGYTRLISPLLDFSSYENVSINFSVWYTNDYGASPDNDYFYVYISNDSGSTWNKALNIGPSTPTPYDWYNYSIKAEDYISFTSRVKICFEASDKGYGSVVEAGVDAVNISGKIAGGIANYTGLIDDLKICKSLLSEEQIYQDYLVGNSGDGVISVIVSEETVTGQDWICEVTPVNQSTYAAMETSNEISIVSYGGG